MITVAINSLAIMPRGTGSDDGHEIYALNDTFSKIGCIMPWKVNISIVYRGRGDNK